MAKAFDKQQKLLFVFIGVALAFTAGSAIRELSSYKEAGVGIAIGMSSLVALFGMFWVADKWKDAITAAITVTYIILMAGMFAIFVFPENTFELEGGAKVVFDDFTGLMKVVAAAYLGQEAVRAAAQAYSNGAAADSSKAPVIDPEVDTK